MKLFKRTVFRISIWWVVSMAILFFLNGKESFLLMIFSALCHEGGHLLAMLLYKVPPVEITFGFLNFNIKYNKGATTHKADIVISSAGVFMNLILCVYATAVKNYELLFVNLSLGFVNLLPLDGLDGGNIISSIRKLRCDDPYEKLLDKVWTPEFGRILAIGCFLTLSVATGFNLSVVFAGVSFMACGEIYKI